MRKVKNNKRDRMKVFVQSLEGCITEENQAQRLDPMELKRIWGFHNAHD